MKFGENHHIYGIDHIHKSDRRLEWRYMQYFSCIFRSSLPRSDVKGGPFLPSSHIIYTLVLHSDIYSLLRDKATSFYFGTMVLLVFPASMAYSAKGIILVYDVCVSDIGDCSVSRIVSEPSGVVGFI